MLTLSFGNVDDSLVDVPLEFTSGTELTSKPKYYGIHLYVNGQEQHIQSITKSGTFKLNVKSKNSIYQYDVVTVTIDTKNNISNSGGEFATAISNFAITNTLAIRDPSKIWQDTHKTTDPVTDMYMGPVKLTNAKIIKARHLSNGVGTIDIYTVPTGRKAMALWRSSYNQAAAAITSDMQIKINGVYYRVEANQTTNANSSINVAGPTFILEAGQTIAIESTSATINLETWLRIIEFDASVPIRTVWTTNIIVGDNLFYTVPQNKNVFVLDAACGITTSGFFNWAINAGVGSANTATMYIVAAGDTTSAANKISNATSINVGARTIINFPNHLAGGDSIVITAISASANNQIIWINIFETTTALPPPTQPSNYLDPIADIDYTPDWGFNPAGLLYEAISDAIRQPAIPNQNSYIALPTAATAGSHYKMQLSPAVNIAQTQTVIVWIWAVARAQTGTIAVNAQIDDGIASVNANFTPFGLTLQSGYFSVALNATTFRTLDPNNLFLTLLITGDISDFQITEIYVETK